MEQANWMEWCTKQMSDLSNKLQRQGFGPAQLLYLEQVDAEFAEHYNTLMDELGAIMGRMAERCDSYSHYEAFLGAKRTFLTYTNANRAGLLGLKPAEAA